MDNGIPQWINDWVGGLKQGTVSVSGNYYYIDSHEYSVAIPKSVSNSTNFAIYRYGAGGYSADSTKAINYVLSNSLDQVTIFPKYEDSYDHIYRGAIGTISNNTRVNSSSVTDIGYSCNYKDSINSTLQNISNNPSLPPQTIVCIDGINYGAGGESYGLQSFANLSSQQIQLLVKNGTKIVAYEKQIDASNQPQTLQVLRNLSAQGVDVVMVSGTNDHGKQRDYAIQSGLFDMSSGNFMNVEKLRDYGYTVYDFEKGNMRQVDYKELKNYFTGGTSNRRGSSTKNKSDTSSTIISVEYGYVNSMVEGIKGLLQGCNIQNVGKVTNETGGASTFKAANNAFNEYAKQSKTFLKNLDVTYDNILKIAESIYSQDKSFARLLGFHNPNRYLSNITNINLSSLDSFFQNVPSISTELTGNIKITREMLLEAISDKNVILSSINTDIEDTKNIQQQLNEFINGSTQKLTGSVWDEVRNKLTEYSQLCDRKITYANALLDGIKSAYTKLLDYLEDYDELDTAKLPEVNDRISKAQADLADLQSQLASLQATHGQSSDTDGDGKVDHVVDNSAAIAATQMQIQMLTEVITMLNEWKGKLEGLPAVDQSSSDIINSASAGGASSLGQSSSPVTSMSAPQNAVMPQSANNNINAAVDNVNLTNKPVQGTTQDKQVQTNNDNYSNTSDNNSSNSDNNTITNLNNTENKEEDLLYKIEEDIDTPDTESEEGKLSIGDDLLSAVQDENKIEDVLPNIQDTNDSKKENSGLKTVGKIIGVAGATAAVGAGAYAIKKQSDKNNDTEE